MSADFTILGSSSSGNCGLLRTAHSKVLLDAGFSGRRICQLLEGVGESIDTIDAVFLTHEHGDHAQGLRGLGKRVDLPVFANRDTADAVQTKLSRRLNWQIFQTGAAFRFRDMEVRSFQLPHDAYDPVGFRFNWGEEGDLFSRPGSMAWIVDLGYVPEHVKAQIRLVDTLMIEANYDEALLEKDEKRPWATKQRIRGRHGHLSNAAVYECIRSILPDSRLKNVFLGHLSKDCNAVDLVRETFADLSDTLRIEVIDPAMGTSPALQPV
jgi:phosphoribosyl 1,2-cyclic phosphodiesterase